MVESMSVLIPSAHTEAVELRHFYDLNWSFRVRVNVDGSIYKTILEEHLLPRVVRILEAASDCWMLQNDMLLFIEPDALWISKPPRGFAPFLGLQGAKIHLR